MNYLSHYVFNHDIVSLPVDPDFAMGVALPDIWPRFSRKRRLKWRAVRESTPPSAPSRQLRAGLLNHAEIDNRFHVTPSFLRWQRELKQLAPRDGLHPMVVDFLAHVSVEIALDYVLLKRAPDLTKRYYATLAEADPTATARRAGRIGAVDTRELENVIALFMEKRFLERYRTQEGLGYAVGGALSLTSLDIEPPRAMIEDMLARACQCVEPETVWRDLTPAMKQR
jgi:hypothetical protein